MELGEALAQIHAIRAQVARTEVFRGYRAITVGCTGMLAFLAAALQPLVIPSPHENLHLYLQWWIGVAAISAVWVAIELMGRWFHSHSALHREQIHHALEQFLPCLVAGACTTWAIVEFSPAAAHLLPGLWSLMFALGVFASCRQLPAPAALIAVYYLAAGAACLALARGPWAFHPWAMAGTFGVGQLLTAAVLYFSLERTDAQQ